MESWSLVLLSRRSGSCVSGCVFHAERFGSVCVDFYWIAAACPSIWYICVRYCIHEHPAPALSHSDVPIYLTLLLASPPPPPPPSSYLSWKILRLADGLLPIELAKNQSADFNNSKVWTHRARRFISWKTVSLPEMAWYWCDCPLLFYSTAVVAHHGEASSFSCARNDGVECWDNKDS
jgi:hypothetical protein